MLYDNLSQQSSQQLTQSQFNQFIGKLEQHQQKLRTQEELQYEVQNQLQPLIYNTLMLDYDIFLYEEQLKYYKIIMTQKESQIKKLKDVQLKKSSKLASIADSMKKVEKKSKQVHDGYKIMNQKKQQYLNSQKIHRSQRLTCQQNKNQLYSKYLELEDHYNNILNQIEHYGTYEGQQSQLYAENEQLSQQIQKLQSRKRAIDGQKPHSRKQELKNEVKKMYQKIKAAQKEQERIHKQYQSRKKKYKHLQSQHQSIGQRNVEINSLYTRLTSLKDELSQRKWTKVEREKQYHQILSQENQLKRQLTRYEQHEAKKRTENKPSTVHNFRIIDSEADQQLAKGNKKARSNSKHQNSVESHQHFDDLIDRFQQIKSKSKHLS